MSYLSLRELCQDISISYGTGRNWIKLGKLTPQYMDNNIPFFSVEYASELKHDIETGKIACLRSRRNKRYASGLSLYRSYISDDSPNIAVVEKLLDRISEQNIVIDEAAIRALLMDCALKLFIEQNNKPDEKLSYKTLTDIIASDMNKNTGAGIAVSCAGSLDNSLQLINDLASDPAEIKKFYEEHEGLFDSEFEYVAGEDLLGLMYMSLRNISGRKAMGAYYTPGKVVNKLVDKLFAGKAGAGCCILDPCCGTGNFLIRLPEMAELDGIFGNDIDKISVMLTRINLALKYRPDDNSILYKNITCRNFLGEYSENAFDYILGNPPWGAAFTDDEKKRYRQRYEAASGKNVESFELFVEESFRHIRKGGIISFVLPEAILNVKIHKPVRRLISGNTSIEYLASLENHFHKVQCPGIILQLRYTGEPMDTRGMLVDDGRREYRIKTGRVVSDDYFNFYITDDEYELINRIMGGRTCQVTFLKDKADFALGLVTGDNARYISSEKECGNEPIIKGTDVYRYRIIYDKNYIDFKPDEFQQVADLSFYRSAEKLIYRFINSNLVFAYDNRGTLTLNSCNVVIPRLEGLSMKYILAILNSRISQFIFTKCFHSIKVLRAHIEALPIPVVDDRKQREITTFVDAMAEEHDFDTLQSKYDELDTVIAGAFGITEEDYAMIKNYFSDENSFLC